MLLCSEFYTDVLIRVVRLYGALLVVRLCMCRPGVFCVNGCELLTGALGIAAGLAVLAAE